MAEQNSDNGQPLVKYSPDAAAIAEMKSRFAGIKSADTPEDYERCRLAIRECVQSRGLVEATKKQLKADALAWNRKVDAGYHAVMAQIEAIEKPIRALRDAKDKEAEDRARAKVEEEKARLAKIESDRIAAEEAERKRLRDIEEARIAEERRQLAAEREAARIEQAKRDEEAKERFQAEREAQRKIDEAKDAERKAAQDRYEAERRQFEAERAEQQKKLDEAAAYQAAEYRRIREEKEKIEQAKRAEQERLDRIEWEKKEQERMAREHQAKVAQEIVDAANRKKAEAAEQARIEAARPDVQKVNQFGRALGAWVRETMPQVTSDAARAELNRAEEDLLRIAAGLLAFKVSKKPAKV